MLVAPPMNGPDRSGMDHPLSAPTKSTRSGSSGPWSSSVMWPWPSSPPLVLLRPRLEARPVLAFVGIYNLLLQTLLPRLPPTRLGVAALVLDLAAVTAGLALTGSNILFSSAYVIVIAMAAGRFQYRGAIGTWAAAAALYVVFVAPRQAAARPNG